MFQTIIHQYSKYANQTLNWLPMDTEILYNQNLKTRYSMLKEHDWIDKKFVYKFNQYGYRSEEFSYEPSMISLGCSNTCGIGMPLENSWTSIVSNSLNLKNFNLGIGASSNDTAFRMAQHWIPQLRPKVVVHMAPARHRFEYHLHSEIQDWGPWAGSVWENWVSNQTNADMNYLKNKLAIERICDNLDIKLVHIEYNTLGDLEFFVDYSRDLTHYGVKTNQKIAEHVLSKM